MANDIFITGTGGVAIFFETIEKLSEALLEILEDRQQFIRSKKILEDYAKQEGKNLLMYCPAEFSFRDVWKRLNKEKIPFLIGTSHEDGKTYIIVRDCDKEEIKRVQTNLYIEKRRISEITNAEFYNYYKDEEGSIIKIDNLSHYQIKLLNEIAQEKNILFTRYRNDDNKYSVFIYIDGSAKTNKEDFDIINSALLELSCKSAGVTAIARESYSNVDRDTIYAAIEKEYAGNKDDFYVIDGSMLKKQNGILAPRSYVKISDGQFNVFKDDAMMQAYNEKEDTIYYEHLALALWGMTSPIVFDKEHFEVSPEKREEYIKKALNEREIKCSNFAHEAFKRDGIKISKDIESIEKDLSTKILDWIDDPEKNKISSISDLINAVPDEFKQHAEYFGNSFSSIYDRMHSTIKENSIGNVHELQDAAARNSEEFIAIFSSREEERQL